MPVCVLSLGFLHYTGRRQSGWPSRRSIAALRCIQSPRDTGRGVGCCNAPARESFAAFRVCSRSTAIHLCFCFVFFIPVSVGQNRVKGAFFSSVFGFGLQENGAI